MFADVCLLNSVVKIINLHYILFTWLLKKYDELVKYFLRTRHQKLTWTLTFYPDQTMDQTPEIEFFLIDVLFTIPLLFPTQVYSND